MSAPPVAEARRTDGLYALGFGVHGLDQLVCTHLLHDRQQLGACPSGQHLANHRLVANAPVVTCSLRMGRSQGDAPARRDGLEGCKT
jgi:hypothetical protein